MLLLLPLLGADLASADPVGDARARARQVAAELDRLGRRLSILDEDFNEARLALGAAQARVTTARARAEETQRRFDAALVRARQRAVAAYTAGGSLSTAVHLPGSASSMRDVTVRREYLRAAAGDDRAAIDALSAAREDLAVERASLESRVSAARAAAATVNARRDAAATAVSAQRRLLAEAQGELSSLVAAEQARRAAADAELAARRARESARTDGAAAPTRTSPDRAARTRTAPAPAPAPAPSSTETAPPPPSASGADAAVAFARSQVGKRYEWGADGPDSYDCSGLTMMSWRQGGVSLPHSSRAQYGATTRVPMSALEPGDLLFYGSPIHHVGIYVGGGQMVEASQPGTPVRYASIHRRDLVGAGRPG